MRLAGGAHLDGAGLQLGLGGLRRGQDVHPLTEPVDLLDRGLGQEGAEVEVSADSPLVDGGEPRDVVQELLLVRPVDAGDEVVEGHVPAVAFRVPDLHWPFDLELVPDDPGSLDRRFPYLPLGCDHLFCLP